jgi:hypothetical protein
MRYVIAILALSVGCQQSIETAAYLECSDGVCRCELSGRSCCDPEVCGYDDASACHRVCEPGSPREGVVSFDVTRTSFSFDSATLCTIDVGGLASCERQFGDANAPMGRFRKVSVSSAGEQTYACAISDVGSLWCWDPGFGGGAELGGTDFIDLQSYIDGGGAAVCGLHADGSIECFGQTSAGTLTPPTGTFRALAKGPGFCAIDTAGELSCWGNAGAFSPPPGPWSSVSRVTESGFCGIRETGAIDCDLVDPAPDGKYLAAVPYVGIREDGWLVSWGASDDREPLPAGRFLDVRGSDTTGCALRESGRLACWGDLEQ